MELDTPSCCIVVGRYKAQSVIYWKINLAFTCKRHIYYFNTSKHIRQSSFAVSIHLIWWVLLCCLWCNVENMCFLKNCWYARGVNLHLILMCSKDRLPKQPPRVFISQREGETDRQTVRQTDRQTYRQTDRQTYRWYVPLHCYIVKCDYHLHAPTPNPNPTSSLWYGNEKENPTNKIRRLFFWPWIWVLHE